MRDTVARLYLLSKENGGYVKQFTCMFVISMLRKSFTKGSDLFGSAIYKVQGSTRTHNQMLTRL